jgi:hypothetical protein
MRVQQATVRPSARLAAGLCLVHALGAGALWLAPLPVAGQMLLTLAIAASLVFYIARDAALHTAGAIVALEIKEDGGLAFQTRSGDWIEAEVLGSSYVSARFTLVNLRPRGGRRVRHLILLADSLDPRDFRRLRVWLRWAARPESGPEHGTSV